MKRIVTGTMIAPRVGRNCSCPSRGNGQMAGKNAERIRARSGPDGHQGAVDRDAHSQRAGRRHCRRQGVQEHLHLQGDPQRSDGRVQGGNRRRPDQVMDGSAGRRKACGPEAHQGREACCRGWIHRKVAGNDRVGAAARGRPQRPRATVDRSADAGSAIRGH